MENEIEFLTKRISADRKKRQELKDKAAWDEYADKVRGAYDAFLAKGFSDEQAFYLTAQLVQKAFEDC